MKYNKISKKAIVQIFNQSKEYLIGTGFFINDSGLMVTAQHVIPTSEHTAFVKFEKKYIKYAVQRKYIKKGLDLLILKPSTNVFTEHFITLGRLPDEINIKSNFYLFGYPFEDNYAEQYPEGLELVGEVYPPNFFNFMNYRGQYYNLSPSQMIVKGFSGSPVFSENGRILGVLCAVPTDEYKKYIFKALSIKHLLELLKIKAIHASCNFHYIHYEPIPIPLADRKQDINNITIKILNKEERIINIIAIGGTGKSVLVRMLIEESVIKTQFEDIIWFNFNTEPFFDKFVNDVFEIIFGDFKNDYSLYSKIGKIIERLKENKFLIILDGLEDILETDSQSPKYGTSLDKAFKDFLDRVANEKMPSKILCTSRTPLKEFKDNNKYSEYFLQDLSYDSAILFLEQNSIKSTKISLNKIFDNFGFHILTLNILCSYLNEFYQGDTSNIDNLLPVPNFSSQSDKLYQILDFYWEKQDFNEQTILMKLSCVRTNFDQSLIDFIFAKSYTLIKSKMLISRLIDRGILKKEIESESDFSVHPLIRTYYYSKLESNGKTEFHKYFAEFYRSCTPDKVLIFEDTYPIIETCYHYNKCENYNNSYELFIDNSLFKILFWSGHYKTILDLLLPIVDNNTFNFQRRLNLLRKVGASFDKNGNPEEGNACFLKIIVLAKENQSLYDLFIGYTYASEPLACQGEYTSSLKYIHSAMELYSEHINYFNDFKASDLPTLDKIIGRRAWYLLDLGHFEEAMIDINNAISIWHTVGQNDAAYGCCWYYIKGKICIKLNLLSDAEESLYFGLSLCREHNVSDFEGLILCSLADLQLRKDNSGNAKGLILNAIKIAQDIGYEYLLCLLTYLEYCNADKLNLSTEKLLYKLYKISNVGKFNVYKIFAALKMRNNFIKFQDEQLYYSLTIEVDSEDSLINIAKFINKNYIEYVGGKRIC